jgi:uncharacterized protein (TIGR02646 family)
MIGKANYNLKLSRQELKELLSIIPWDGHKWDKPPTGNISNIISKIRKQLESCQSVCSYCGLPLYGTSRGEIEHIAAKATKFRHPEFTFTLKNLTLSCHWCNTSEKKGTKETILQKHKIYSKCEFNIVHPYFDDPDDHYEWTDNNVEVLIQVKNNSSKAKLSIEMFGLDSLKMNEHRAMKIRFQELKNNLPLPMEDEELIKRIVEK